MGEAWPLRPSSGLTFCALGAAWGSDAGTGVNVDGFIKKTEYLGGPFGPALRMIYHVYCVGAVVRAVTGCNIRYDV